VRTPQQQIVHRHTDALVPHTHTPTDKPQEDTEPSTVVPLPDFVPDFDKVGGAVPSAASAQTPTFVTYHSIFSF
jgi:hypothetical protein